MESRTLVQAGRTGSLIKFKTFKGNGEKEWGFQETWINRHMHREVTDQTMSPGQRKQGYVVMVYYYL